MTDTVPGLKPVVSATPERNLESDKDIAEGWERRARAAVDIQRHYRGHKERREMDGMCLTPDQRWTEAVSDARWRRTAHVSPHGSQAGQKPEKPTWDKAVKVAMRAQHDDPDRGQVDGDEYEAEDDMKRISTRRKAQHDMTTMDIQYFLEMVDVKHRHAHNLRAYHEYWKLLDTNENFFRWLDYGEGKKVNLKEVPRETLEREKIRYLSLEERQAYLVNVDEDGRLCWARNGQRIDTTAKYADSRLGIVPSDHPEAFHQYHPDRGEAMYRPSSSSPSPISPSSISPSESEPESSDYDDSAESNPGKTYVSSAEIFNRLLRKPIRKNTWIFVADISLRLYVGIKQSGTFQHSSFLHGARVRAAGLIKIKDGKLKSLSPLSGHYRPAPSQFRAFLKSLQDTGVDLSGIAIARSYAILVGLGAYSKFKTGKKEIMSASKKVVDKATPSGHGHGRWGSEEKRDGEMAVGKGQATEEISQPQANDSKELCSSHGLRGDDGFVETLMHDSRDSKIGPV